MIFKKKPTYTDQEIVDGILAGGAQKQRITSYLYKQYVGYVIKGQRKYRISEEDARDAYAEAIVGLSRQIERGGYRGDSKLTTYLFGAFSNKCVDKLRKLSSNKVDWVEDIPAMPEKARGILHELISKEEVDRLAQFMSRLGDKCRQILLDSEYHGYSVDEIAKRVGLKNGPTVSSMKYRCMEKLRTLVAKRKATFG